jgi:uncharacterized protein YcbX
MFISALYYYPIKSCGGLSTKSVDTDLRGIKHDRRWLLIGTDGVARTQRQIPKLALVQPLVCDNGDLQVAAEGFDSLIVPVVNDGAKTRAKVWSSVCRSVDQGDEAAEWFSEFTGQRLRLVRMADDFTRRVDGRYARSKNDQVSFADGFPFLIIGQASLEDLNRRMDAPLPMNRFRPNIVVEGSEPFAEDQWVTVSIGELIVDIVKPCARCEMTAINQSTAERGKEPLKTLSTYRNDRGRILFGQNVIPRAAGRLALGDCLTVVEAKESGRNAARI